MNHDHKSNNMTIHKKIFSTVLAMFCAVQVFSQVTPAFKFLPKECRTPAPTHDHLKDIPPGSFKVLAGTRVMKMYIVVYSDDNGTNTAIDEATLKNEIAFTNTVYNQGDICFTIVGIEFRNSTVYNNPAYPDNYTSQQVAGAFTVFIVHSIDGQVGNNGTFGWAPNTPASYMVTKNAGFGTRRTFIHEMGHALGLAHTFNGTGHDPDNVGCDELVNGSNGTTCGDFVADTPADPYTRCGDAISGCTFPYTAPACKDANGASYSPQMNNYMSYWPNFGCNRTVFTAGQYTRMQSTIDNNATLSSFLATDYVDLTNTIISSGFVKQAAKLTLNAGNIGGAGNYTVNGSAQAAYSSSLVILKPGFTAAPNASGIVRILANNCQ